MNEYQNLYYDVKKLYDSSEYNKCIDKSLKIIKGQEKLLLETKNYVLLANLYELQADCLERKGDTEQAVEVIRVLLSKMGQFLTDENTASIKLKIGHIFKRTGFYSKALFQFKKVEQEYEKAFPNRFAKYAKDNYDDIASKQVATISGKVSLEDNEDCSNVTVKVFNGFEESEATTLQNGEYSIPLFSSTPGTMFSLFVYKQGYNPIIINKKFEGASKIVIEKIQLKKFPNESMGIVAGVVFTSISGGKIKPHHGIARFVEKYEIKIKRLSETKNENKTYVMSSDENGSYLTLLPPGLYLINNGKNEREFKIDIRKEEVIIINISIGETLID